MNRKILTCIVGCFALGIGIVIFLSAVSTDMRKMPGSFLRLFPPHPAIEGNAFDLTYNSYYIAGGTNHHVYLANYTSPLRMIVVNTVSRDTQHVKLNVKGIKDQKFWAVRVKVDSPNFYVTDGAVPRIYKGNVRDWRAARFPYDSTYFLDIAPIGSGSFVIKALGKPVRENILGKISSTLPHLQMKEGILQKQIDGVFCTDGMMHYTKTLDQLIYLYYYRNQYIVMDTNLNVIGRMNTIDTTSKVKIKVAPTSLGSWTLASPPRMVNKLSSVSGNLLFVNSTMLARNESPNATNEATTIDVYDLKTSEYKFSFYIYDYQAKERLRNFQVFGDKLLAMFNKHLQVWKLTPNYFR